MQTPSIAAMTGTSDSSTTWVRRWNSSMVAANDSWSASAASNRSSPAEKSSPAPRTTMQRTSGSVPATWTASAIAAIVAPPHALRWRWLSQLTMRAVPSTSVLTFMSPRMASGSWSPRAVLNTFAVLCSATGERARCERVDGDLGAQRGFESLRVGVALDVDV